MKFPHHCTIILGRSWTRIAQKSRRIRCLGSKMTAFLWGHLIFVGVGANFKVQNLVPCNKRSFVRSFSRSLPNFPSHPGCGHVAPSESSSRTPMTAKSQILVTPLKVRQRPGPRFSLEISCCPNLRAGWEWHNAGARSRGHSSLWFLVLA